MLALPLMVPLAAPASAADAPSALAPVAGVVALDGEDDANWGTKTDFGAIGVDCIIPGPGTEYRVVFGYRNNGEQLVHRPVSSYPASGSTTTTSSSTNLMSLSSLNGSQVSYFEPGTRHGAFTTAVVTASSVSWTVGGTTVTATRNSPTCGSPVSLPAQGNGTGPALVLLASLVVATFLLWARRRRLEV